MPNRDEENQLLEELVRRYSPSGEEGPATAFLLETFRRWGWTARIDEAGNAVGELGAGAPTLCFLGHIDTVEGEIPVRREGTLLHGRGTVDAKGPLMAAACAAARLPRDLDKRIVIVGAVEEETFTSRGARHIVEQLRPDLCLIGEPSRWDRVTIGYKGILHFRWALEGPRAHGAAEGVSVGTRCVQFGAAVLALARALGGGEESPFHGLTCNVRSIRSTVGEFAERAEAAVDMRLPPALDPDAVEREVRGLAQSAAITIVEKLPAVRADKGSRLVRALVAAIRRHGGTPRFALKTGTSDMNIVAPVWQCPIAAYGPGDSSLDHTPIEHIDLEEYQKAIDVLEMVFLAL